MSYFDDASLVMIPSGYKDQKVYSVKPLDGSGDLTFSRASSATRVASNGLIEKVRTNIILQSQDFTTTWSTNASPTITANTTVAPDGTTTADTIAATGSGSGVFQLPTVANGVEYSFSVYIKNITSATNIQIGCDLAPANGYVIFNAVSGTITSVAAGITGSSVTNVGNGWYRVSGTYITTGTTNTSIVYGSGVMTFAAWGYQLETGVTTDYIATTTAAVSVGPVSGLPRLDYLNSTCPRLLLEPQRTNLALYSEQFNNSVWIKEPSNSATANTIASPDGYVNADTITAADGATINIYQSQTSASNTAHTFSAFLKKNNLSEVQLYMFSSGFVSRATVNFDNGTITDVVGSGSTITNYGNGWYRCSIQGTINSGVGFTTGFLSTASSGSKSVYAYGGQLEVGAYATSYIPTLGTSVTRVADMSGTTDYFGAQTFAGNFTFFVDLLPMEGNTGTGDAMILGGGDYTGGGNFQSYFRFASGNIILRGVAEALLIERNYTMTANQQYKILVTRTGTTVKIFANGAQVGASATSSTSVILRSLGWSYIQAAYNYDGRINQVLLMPSGLTDAQAIELTTL